MISATLDTNVLVSATFWRGDSDRIVGLAELGKIGLVLSPAIIEEFSRVLSYDEIKKKVVVKNLEIKRGVEKIISISTIVNPKLTVNIVKEDPADNKILECAIEGNVDFIVTQDRHLLRIAAYEKIIIVSPRDFLKALRL